jgi:hypothetical protein
MPFKEDLAEAQIWEYKAARTLGLIEGYLIRMTTGLKHDIELLVPHLVEVKTDFKSEQTGNIYIETFNRKQGVASGLHASTADLWVYCIPHLNCLFKFERVSMVAYINENYADLHQVPGGDANSVGYLLPIIELEKLEFVTKITM